MAHRFLARAAAAHRVSPSVDILRKDEAIFDKNSLMMLKAMT